MSLKYVIFFLNFCIITSVYTFSTSSQKQCILVIAPSGDAQNPGREIDDSYERALTLQWAHALKAELEYFYPNALIIISRSTGQTIEPLHHAKISNQLNADFFIALNAYHHQKATPLLHCFYTCFNKNTDHLLNYEQPFCFIPAHKAYTLNFTRSKNLALLFFNRGSSIKNSKITFSKPEGLPFKEQKTILAPTLTLEIGIKKSYEWELSIDPTIQALTFVIDEIIKQKNIT